MALQNTALNSAAFDRPGGEPSGSPHPRPIDLAHLARQTLGDRAAEQEVLQMFVCQALLVRDRILQASAKERFYLAHGLKGSARGSAPSRLPIVPVRSRHAPKTARR
jgi:hypothetical protein